MNIQQQIIDDFELFDDWTEKYQYIIELGEKLPPFTEIDKTEGNKIKGCQSNVWFAIQQQNGLITMNADSDSAIVKGLAALVIMVLNNQTPEHIINTELNFIEAIGLKQHLAQTRANGLSGMIKQVKLFAVAVQ